MDLRKVFNEYKESCYGKEDLSLTHRRELEQAFLAGMVFILTESPLDIGKTLDVVTKRLVDIMSFQIPENN